MSHTIHSAATYTHTCICRRRKVASAAKNMWPGNNIPTFKNDEARLKELDKLVKSLLPECEMPCFSEQGIRRHILDCLTERRRQIKKGHDYENVSSWFLHSRVYKRFIDIICTALTIKENKKRSV